MKIKTAWLKNKQHIKLCQKIRENNKIDPSEMKIDAGKIVRKDRTSFGYRGTSGVPHY